MGWACGRRVWKTMSAPGVPWSALGIDTWEVWIMENGVDAWELCESVRIG